MFLYLNGSHLQTKKNTIFLVNFQDQGHIFASTAITKKVTKIHPKITKASQGVLQEGLKPGGLAHAQSY